jgi:DNA polymerase III epsilon subunit family exonuclease
VKKRKVQKIGFNIKPFDDLVVFDLETTGFAPADIIQIAAVRMIGGEIIETDSFFSYVKPGRPLDPFIIAYTGITPEDVKDAPRPDAVIARFLDYCRQSLLVAHNGQSFDVPMIRSVCEKYGIKTRTLESIDSMHLSWNLWGRRKVASHGLDAVIARSNISKEGIRRHDARGDVRATAQCVRHMVKELERRPEAISLNINNCLFPQMI